MKLVVVSDGVRDLEIPFADFPILFNPAYAVTCHKSQGATYDHPYSIHEWNRMTIPMKYVALSRATNLANINISSA